MTQDKTQLYNNYNSFFLAECEKMTETGMLNFLWSQAMLADFTATGGTHLRTGSLASRGTGSYQPTFS
jgi:hypothetical protein